MASDSGATDAFSSPQHQLTTQEDPSTPTIRVQLEQQDSPVLHEIRNMSAILTSRLDGFNARLGDMEHWRRELPDSPSPEPRRALNTSIPTTLSTTTAQPAATAPTNVVLNRPNRGRDVIPPHMTRTAAALASPTIAPPSRPSSVRVDDDTSSNPLDRYRKMSKTEKGNIKRTLEKLGVTLQDFMGAMLDGDTEGDTGSITGSGEAGQTSTPTANQTADQGSPSTTSASPAILPADNNQQPSVTSLDPVVTSSSATLPSETVPTPSKEPAPNISPPTAGSSRPLTCKPEFLGSFSGDPNRLEAFLSRVGDLIRGDDTPPWRLAVLRALPICLKDDAAVWHEGLSDEEAANLTSFEKWAAAMREAFPVNKGQLRKDAWTRKWDPVKETAGAYYFHKLRLLRQAFGKQQPEDVLLTDIKEGLPDNMVSLLRLPREGATLQDLRLELGEWETNWRNQTGIRLQSTESKITTSASTVTQTPRSSPAMTRASQQSMVRSASAPAIAVPTSGQGYVNPTASPRATPSVSSAPGISPLAASYDPSRVTPAANGKPRTYRPPGRDTALTLHKPCTKCGQDHFNFEHDHIVPQLRTMMADDDNYPEVPVDDSESQGEREGETEETSQIHTLSPSSEPGLAPSMYSSKMQTQSPRSSVSEDVGLYIAEKSIFSMTRTLRPNESAPPLAQEKQAFGKIVKLSRPTATGTGQGYRDHVPLTTHVRVNDTDGRAMSTLLDTGASMSCIDVTLLRKMGGEPSGASMIINGIGTSITLGWVTIPIFIHAQDPHGTHVHLEVEQDFHVLPSFPPGMCLGLDFIDAHRISISPVRGRARIGRYTFQVHEKMEKPYASEAELCTTTDITIAPDTQAWVPVNAACLAPGIDYTVGPRLSITPDESVRLAGPVGLITHGPTRHILVGNYGTTAFQLEKGTIVADAVAARVGDILSAVGESYTLGSFPPNTPSTVPTTLPTEDVDVAMPFDPFDDLDPSGGSIIKD
ncbi:hypothetical protein CF326_g8567, partial [Tilletia indica]